MPGAAHTHASGIHPFCYGHYTEMRSHEAASSKGRLVYSCQERDCPVQYSRPEGYFLDVENRPLKHWPVPPHQYCPNDRYPMYLLEVNRKQHFRLWRCPKCSVIRVDAS